MRERRQLGQQGRRGRVDREFAPEGRGDSAEKVFLAPRHPVQRIGVIGLEAVAPTQLGQHRAHGRVDMSPGHQRLLRERIFDGGVVRHARHQRLDQHPTACFDPRHRLEIGEQPGDELEPTARPLSHLLRCPGLLLGPLAIGHVHAGSDVSQELARRPPCRLGPRLEPTQFAIGPRDPDLGMERSGLFHGLGERRRIGLEVGRMNQVGPPIACHVLARHAEVAAERLVDEHLPPAGIVLPDHVGQVVGEPPEPLLACPQRRLGEATGGDVVEHQGKTAERFHRSGEDIEPPAHRRGVVLEPEGLAFQRHSGVRLDPAALEFGHQFSGRPANCVGETRHRLELTVGDDEAVVDGSTGVVQHHFGHAVPLVDRIEQRVEAGFARSQRLPQLVAGGHIVDDQLDPAITGVCAHHSRHQHRPVAPNEPPFGPENLSRGHVGDLGYAPVPVIGVKQIVEHQAHHVLRLVPEHVGTRPTGFEDAAPLVDLEHAILGLLEEGAVPLFAPQRLFGQRVRALAFPPFGLIQHRTSPEPLGPTSGQLPLGHLGRHHHPGHREHTQLRLDHEQGGGLVDARYHRARSLHSDREDGAGDDQAGECHRPGAEVRTRYHDAHQHQEPDRQVGGPECQGRQSHRSDQMSRPDRGGDAATIRTGAPGQDRTTHQRHPHGITQPPLKERLHDGVALEQPIAHRPDEGTNRRACHHRADEEPPHMCAAGQIHPPATSLHDDCPHQRSGGVGNHESDRGGNREAKRQVEGRFRQAGGGQCDPPRPFRGPKQHTHDQAGRDEQHSREPRPSGHGERRSRADGVERGDSGEQHPQRW